MRVTLKAETKMKMKGRILALKGKVPFMVHKAAYRFGREKSALDGT